MPFRVFIDATDVWRSMVGEPDVAATGAPPPAATAPSQPRNVTATVPAGLYRAVRVAWSAPADDGGAPVTRYEVQRVGASGTQFVPASETSFDWAGLVAGVAVSFTVAARNSAGLSRLVQTSPVTPALEPPGGGGGGTSGDYFGWDPASWSAPAERSVLAFHDNTGLFRSQDMSALQTYSGDFTTSSSGQRVERLDITGKVNVKHAGVVFKFCRIQGQVVSYTVGSATPPMFIYCDLGYKLGAASTSATNMTDGHALLYCCNWYNWVDGIGIKKSAVSTTPTSVARDCFIHDSRICPTDGANSPSHNDLIGQTNQPNAKVDVTHCTVFCSGTNNDTGSQTCTRSSGPNWSGSNPLTASFPGAGTGGVSNGRINAGFMVKANTSAQIKFYRNVFRGYAYVFVNGQPGNRNECVDNVCAPDEQEAGRTKNPFGDPSYYAVYRGNENLKGEPV